jgi:hypothetical protein
MIRSLHESHGFAASLAIIKELNTDEVVILAASHYNIKSETKPSYDLRSASNPHHHSTRLHPT